MKYVIFPLFIFLFISLPVLASSWPASDQSGTSIGDTLLAMDPTFEPSGTVWHGGRNEFILVGDEGQVATIGESVTIWNLGSSYDLEDVTVADESSSYVYLLDENTSSALEFDLDTGSLTGKSWSFSDKISEVNGAGAEGLAWVEDSFFVGWQYDGDIYVYPTNINISQSQQYSHEIHMTSGNTDLSGLSYNEDTQTVTALYDGLNLLEERTVSGEMIASYSVPGHDQEGVTIVTSCPSTSATIVIAEDSGRVMSYSGYPVTCSGDDTQAVSYLSYEISNDGIDNDGDGEIDENNTLVENGVHPVYGSLDPYDGSLVSSSLTSYAGTTNGDLFVTLGDGSVYLYDAISLNAPQTNTSIRRLRSTAFLVVWSSTYASIVNPYSGEIVATTVFQRGNIHPIQWANQVLGL